MTTSPDTFLGRGASFPLRLSATGGIQESGGLTDIQESLRVILGTQYGERAMRPTFGCNLRTLVFDPINDATANLARFYVSEGIAQWEPRVEVLEVQVEPDPAEGLLRIEVFYRVRATQEVGTFVYPFYVQGA
jgi:uncharacterized protein